MSNVRFFVPALALALLGSSSAQEPKQPSPELLKATAKAKVHNKRVLAILAEKGEDFAATLKKDRTTSRPVLYEFETVQFAGEQADAMALQWKMPDALQTKPALLVLDGDGKVLARLPNEAFTTDGTFAADTLLEKLKPHYCAPADAEQKLAAGLAEGKKTGRAVFVRFDAPW